ncbi:hypothetical protein EUGRSUZ_L02989 [Eucalyptus grandis]|uniref:Uncharacterized protein n=1 Tax=Eucalyptus grandis TaxID=71139 RepID=A0AAD9T9G0_EUCGR|nr:hypothetical protein EUGRSUZ_L02989 [Eucalyptus grandis]
MSKGIQQQQQQHPTNQCIARITSFTSKFHPSHRGREAKNSKPSTRRSDRKRRLENSPSPSDSTVPSSSSYSLNPPEHEDEGEDEDDSPSIGRMIEGFWISGVVRVVREEEREGAPRNDGERSQQRVVTPSAGVDDQMKFLWRFRIRGPPPVRENERLATADRRVPICPERTFPHPN